MISAILFLFSLFSYSQMECDICSWPWAAGVNTQGQCYLLYENGVPLSQGGLQAGCYTYCDAWARSSGNSMPATPMLSFSDVGGAISCQCQRLNAWGEIEYRSRPSGSCDWGYSDAVQRHYDSISQNLSPAKRDSFYIDPNKAQQIKSVLDRAVQLENSGYYMASCGFSFESGSTRMLVYQNIDYQYATISLPGNLTCTDFYSGNMSQNSAIIGTVLESNAFLERTQLGVKQGIDQVQKTVASGQSSILDALARLESKPSGGGGGEVNLGPVMEAIENAKQAQLGAIRGVGDSVGGMGSRLAGRMMSIETGIGGVQGSIDRQGVTLDGIKTEMSGLGGKVDAVGDKVGSVGDSVGGVRRAVVHQTDTVVSVRRAVDRLRGVLDSMYRWDKDETAPRFDRIREAIEKQNGVGDSISTLKPYYQKIVDSLRRVARGTDSVGARMSRSIDTIGSVRRSVTSMDSGVEARWKSDKRDDSGAYNRMMDSIRGRDGSRAEAESKLSELEGTSSAAEDQSTGFLSSLGLFQSLPGTCREAPVFTLDLSPLGSMSIDINQYPWALTLSRGLMRFVGAFSALMMIMGSLKIFSMTRREAT